MVPQLDQPKPQVAAASLRDVNLRRQPIAAYSARAIVMTEVNTGVWCRTIASHVDPKSEIRI
jgi:hypothetical protein